MEKQKHSKQIKTRSTDKSRRIEKKNTWNGGHKSQQISN